MYNTKIKLINDYIGALCLNNKPAVQKPENNGIIYVIKQGDTLYSIARKYGVTVDDLYRNNPGIKANALKPGNSIKIK